MIHEATLDWILMDVVGMVHEVLAIANAVVGKPSLPDFPSAAENRAKGMRVSAFDQLNRTFDCHVWRRGEQ